MSVQVVRMAVRVVQGMAGIDRVGCVGRSDAAATETISCLLSPASTLLADFSGLVSSMENPRTWELYGPWQVTSPTATVPRISGSSSLCSIGVPDTANDAGSTGLSVPEPAASGTGRTPNKLGICRAIRSRGRGHAGRSASQAKAPRIRVRDWPPPNVTTTAADTRFGRHGGVRLCGVDRAFGCRPWTGQTRLCGAIPVVARPDLLLIDGALGTDDAATATESQRNIYKLSATAGTILSTDCRDENRDHAVGSMDLQRHPQCWQGRCHHCHSYQSGHTTPKLARFNFPLEPMLEVSPPEAAPTTYLLQLPTATGKNRSAISEKA